MATSLQTLIEDARNYAAEVLDDARDAATDAVNSVMAIGYAYPNYENVSLPKEPVQSLDLVEPTLTDVTLDLPDEPDNTLVFQDISEIEPGVAPEFTDVAPTVELPTKPNQIAEFQGVAPSINTDIAFPEPPDELMQPLLEAPVLADREEPTAPQLSLPLFDGVMPEDTTEAPTNLDQTLATAYEGMLPNTVSMLNGYVDAMLAKYNPQFHTQMERLENKLTAFLSGERPTALTEEIEKAIYQRAKDRNNNEFIAVQTRAWEDMAARGFTLPPGALAAANRAAFQAAADNNVRTSWEIATKQAELEQQNIQFAITTSAGLRTALLSATQNYFQTLTVINGQAIDYAKSLLTALIETYNASVRMYTAKLDAYKAQAQVYETKLRGAMASIELYRAEIAALEAMTNVDKTKVDIYRARIGSLEALAAVYRSQIEAVQGRVNLEKLRLDVFQASVQAYGAQVQAKNAEWEGYKASIEGETSKVRVFGAQAEAFNTRVNAYRAKIDAMAQVVQSQAVTNRARADQYGATVDAYRTIVGARGDVARTKIESQSQKLVAFQAKVSAAVANANVGSEYYRAVSGVALENAKNRLNAQISTVNSLANFRGTIAELTSANAKSFAALANAAMSGMNTLVSETAQSTF